MTQLLQSYDLVVTDCSIIDENGMLLETSFFKSHGSKAGFWPNVIKNSYLGCCMAFRRSLLEKALPLPPKVPMHDIWLGILAEWYGTPYFHPEQLMAYRRHSSNTTGTGAKSSNSIWIKIMFRYNLIMCFARRMFRNSLPANL
jgi:hypothetical protein